MRNLIIGAGALGAAGVSTFIITSKDSGDTGEVVEALESSGGVVCLKGDIEFFEGVGAGCYTKQEILKFRDAPLIDRQDRRALVEMTHPAGASRATARCGTCREYNEHLRDGWYAMSSRDMRRESYFVRACGAIEMLFTAAPAENSYFDNGSPSLEEMQSLRPAQLLRLGDDPGVAADEAAPAVEKTEDYHWLIEADGQAILVQEIANADFDNDGIAEILVFLSAWPKDGASAVVTSIALLEKDSVGALITLTLKSFIPTPRRASGAP